MKTIEAAYEAGKSRFRAILLTSITTVAGLYPLILADSRQAEFLVPMAISVVYGVLFGTLFILLFFPPLIVFLSDCRVFFWWCFHALWTGDLSWPTREQVEPAVKEERTVAKYFQDGSQDSTPTQAQNDAPIPFS